MPDYMTTVTAEKVVPKVTQKQAMKLCEALGHDPKADVPWHSSGDFITYTHDESQYTVEWCPKDSELYIFAEDNATTGEVPEAFWIELARLLTAKKMDYLEFGFANHCSKPCVGSFSGGEFRVYRDGKVIYADIKHPKHKIKNA